MILDGIKVVEMGQFIFVPYAAVHLADLGADVIKLENPAGGDPQRNTKHAHLPQGDFNFMFEQNNRGKKSLAINVNTPEGQQVAHRLIAQTDVFLTNFQVPTLQRMHMDYDTLAQVNPRLIYALGTGYGLKGPDKDLGAFDYGIFARSGLMASFGEEGTPLVQCQPGMGDHISAMNICAAIGMALYYRSQTGKGQFVHASLLGSMLDAGSLSLQSALATGQEVKRKKRSLSGNPLCNSYADKTGEWFQLSSKQPDRNWHDFCEALGLQHIENDPRYRDTAAREHNCEQLIALLDKKFATMTVDEIAAAFKGKTVHWSRAYTYGMVAKDPQALDNEYIVESPHPKVGKYKNFGCPWQFSAAPPEVHAGTPELGEQNEEILLSLGYTWDDIIKLKEKDILL